MDRYILREFLSKAGGRSPCGVGLRVVAYLMGEHQDAGEMLLDIETRIGELAEKEERAKPTVSPAGRYVPTGKEPKYERLGIPVKRMQQSQAIAKHPEIVEEKKCLV